jgi:hypothetical protein
MMITMNLSSFLDIAAVGIAILAVLGAALAIYAARRMGRRLRTSECALASMRHDIELIAGTSARNGQRLDTLESGWESFSDRVRLVELRSGSRSFDEAIEFARRGADAGKLTEQFGLSGGEADLVTRLHRKTRP